MTFTRLASFLKTICTTETLREMAVIGSVSLLLMLGYFGFKVMRSPVARSEDLESLRRLIEEHPVMRPGGHLSLPTTTRQYALVIASSTDCIYCAQDAPLHKRLMAQAETLGLDSLLAFPQVRLAGSFLIANGFDRRKAVDWTSIGLRPYGTPTIVLAESNGTILKLWPGRIDATSEKEIDDAIRHPKNIRHSVRRMPSGHRIVPMVELLSTISTTHSTILNVAERHSYRHEKYPIRSLNIPFMELRERIQFDLDPAESYLLDCTTISLRTCSSSFEILVAAKFHVFPSESITP